MKGISTILLGFTSLYKAFKLIQTKNWWWFAFIPFLFMVCMYSVGLSFEKEYEPVKANSIHEWVWNFFREMVALVISFVLTKASKYLVIASLSPLLTYLSAQAHFHETNAHFPFSFRQLYADILRSLKIIFRNLRYEYFIYLIIYLVFILFGLDRKSLFFILPTFFVSAYFYGFAYVDYTLERYKFSVKESVNWVRENWGFVVVIGTFYGFVLKLPVEINSLFFIGKSSNWFSSFIQLGYLIVLSFLPIITVIAATLGAVHLNKNSDVERGSTSQNNE